MIRRPFVAVTVVVNLAMVTLTSTTVDAAALPERTNVADVGHRGASADAPENTIASFKEAAAQHADLFELDVQETKDHQLVIVHDTTLARTTNVESVFPRRRPWNVRAFTLAEIRRLDAGSWFSKRFKGERVPTLDETLQAMRGTGLGLLLEIKKPELYPGIEGRVAAVLMANPNWVLPDGNRRLIVQSFNFGSARRFHSLLPWVPIGLLGTPKAARLPELATFADQINPPFKDLTPGYVRRVHDLGMEIFTWTIDDPATMRRAIAAGVAGVITNKPGVLRDVVGGSAPRYDAVWTADSRALVWRQLGRHNT